MHLAGATMIGGARTAHNTLLRLLAALAQLLRGLIVVPLMARSFGPESYGLFAAALSLVSIGRTLIWNVGPVLTAAIVREPGREAVLLRGAAREIAACAVVLWLAFGGIAVGWYHDRSAVVLVLVLGVSLFTDVVALRGASLSARAQEGALTVFQTVASLTSVAAVVVVCKLGGGTRAIAAAFALCALLHAVLIARASARVAPAPAPAAQATRHLVLRLAAPALFINLAGALSSNVDLVLLGHWSGAVALGSYAAASRMLGVGMLLPNAVAAAAVPALAADRARGLERCIRVTALLGFVAIPVAAFAGFYAPAAPWLLGRSYAAATALVPLLAGRVALGFLSAPLDVYALAVDRQRQALAWHVASVATLALGCCVLIPRLGPAGAAIAAIVAEAAKLLGLLSMTDARARRALWRQLQLPLVIAVATVAAVHQLRAGWLAQTAAALAIYGGANALACRSASSPLRQVWRVVATWRLAQT